MNTLILVARTHCVPLMQTIEKNTEEPVGQPTNGNGRWGKIEKGVKKGARGKGENGIKNGVKRLKIACFWVINLKIFRGV